MSGIGRYTVYKVSRKSGYAWMGRLTIGQSSKGPIRKSICGATKDEALTKVIKLKADLDNGQLQLKIAPRLHDFGMDTIRHNFAKSIKPNTASNYLGSFESYISPYLGGLKLTEVYPDDVENWMSKLQERGLSKTTINSQRKMLKRIFRFAIRHGLATRNPVELTDPMRRTKEDKPKVQPPLDEAEFRQYLDTSKGTEFDLFVHLALLLALRRGEMLGLRWSDIDYELGVIHINGSLGEQATTAPDGSVSVAVERGEPKTENSLRSLSLAAPILTSIARHKEFCDEKVLKFGLGVRPDYVFFASNGKAYWPGNFAKRFNDWRAASGLRHTRIHDLRVTSIQTSFALGVPETVIQQGAGHSRLETTKNVYAKNVPQLAQMYGHGISAHFFTESLELGLEQLVQEDQKNR